jgi:ribosomal protein L23
MYIRLKRKNQTVFLHIDPSDNFFQIKQRIAEMFNLDTAAVTLISGDKVINIFYIQFIL